MHSVLIHCLCGNNQSASVGKEFHTTLSNFNLQSKMFCLNFLNFISNYSKLRVKMAWPRHVISKRIINCQKVQILILIQATPFSCYTSARARKQVFQIKWGCSSYMYYYSFEMSLLPHHHHHQEWWHYLASKSYSLMLHLCHQQWFRSPLLFCESDKLIKLLCKALSAVNPEEKENEILQDLVHVAIHTKPG